jgi:hypothetical protein
MLSHAGNGAAELCWHGAPTHGCGSCGKVAQPRDQSVEVLSHREEVEYVCWLVTE